MSWISDNFSSFMRGAFPGLTGTMSDMTQSVDRQAKEEMRQYMEAAKRTKEDTDQYFKPLRDRSAQRASEGHPNEGLSQRILNP